MYEEPIVIFKFAMHHLTLFNLPSSKYSLKSVLKRLIFEFAPTFAMSFTKKENTKKANIPHLIMATITLHISLKRFKVCNPFYTIVYQYPFQNRVLKGLHTYAS